MTSNIFDSNDHIDSSQISMDYFHGQVIESVAVPTIKKRACLKNQNISGEKVTGIIGHRSSHFLMENITVPTIKKRACIKNRNISGEKVTGYYWIFFPSKSDWICDPCPLLKSVPALKIEIFLGKK